MIHAIALKLAQFHFGEAGHSAFPIVFLHHVGVFAMQAGVAFSTQGNQVLFDVITRATPRLLVVYFQLSHPAAELAAPAVAGQYLATMQSLLADDLKTEVHARLPLEKVASALEQYAANMTLGKVFQCPEPDLGFQQWVTTVGTADAQTRRPSD